MENDELYHHGIRGQKWGRRRYQNKDGSLTPAGKKRYDKEMDKLKAEKKKLVNESRTKKKLDKLDQMKSDVDTLKKKNKGENTNETNETPEAKRARLLKSTDAKELYENKDLLTTNELNERINRIDTEARLKSKISEEHAKTGMEYINDKMRKGSDTINNATNLYKKVDDAYSTVARSAIGKMVAKELGLEPPKKEFNLDDFWKNRNKKSNQEIQDAKQRVINEKIIETEYERRKKAADEEKRLQEARKQVDEYYKKLMEDQNNPTTYSRKGKNIIDSKWERTPINDVDRNNRNQLLLGQTYIAGLLEDPNRR